LAKNEQISHRFSVIFLPKLEKMETGKFVFYLVAFDSTELSNLALQNNRYHF